MILYADRLTGPWSLRTVTVTVKILIILSIGVALHDLPNRYFEAKTNSGYLA